MCVHVYVDVCVLIYNMCVHACAFVLVRVRVCGEERAPYLYSRERCGKALVKIIASKRNVRAELRPPQRDLLGERGPRHGIERVVSHLQNNTTQELCVSILWKQ